MRRRIVKAILALVVFLIILPYVLMSKKAVARIVGGYEGCKVTRVDNGIRKTLDAEMDMKLYPKDRLFKWEDIKSVKFDFLPYAEKKIKDNSTLIIVINPPKNKENILTEVGKLLGLLKRKFYERKGAVKDELVKGTGPLENATLIADHKIYFGNYLKGKTVVFKELQGKEFHRKTFKDDLFFTPAKFGLKHSKTYIWEILGVDGLHYRSLIRVLDKKDEEVVNKALAKIDLEEINEEAIIIKKAAYLQLLSDLYPEQVDLYWLSYQILNNAELNKDEFIDLQDVLMGRCVDHFKGGISGPDFAILNTPGCLMTVELKREGKKRFVAPDDIFQANDVYSLHFQTNFKGYAVILYVTKDKLEVIFPSETTKYEVESKSGYRSCYYSFGKKRSIETYLFILSKKPIKEMDRFMKLSGDKWKCGKELNLQQRKYLVKLIKRLKNKGEKIDLEMMGTKGFAKTPDKTFAGIVWFVVSPENYGE